MGCLNSKKMTAGLAAADANAKADSDHADLSEQSNPADTLNYIVAASWITTLMVRTDR
jgi:hypothetical protein